MMVDLLDNIQPTNYGRLSATASTWRRLCLRRPDFGHLLSIVPTVDWAGQFIGEKMVKLTAEFMTTDSARYSSSMGQPQILGRVVLSWDDPKREG